MTTTFEWPALPKFPPRTLREETIEHMVERQFDAADAALMSGRVGQEDYDARAKAIGRWADDLIAKCIR